MSNHSSDVLPRPLALTRRGLVAALSGLSAAFSAAAAKLQDPSLPFGHDSIYTRLFGIRPLLSCRAHTTIVGGSRMPEEVLRAMAEANDYFVDMHELNAAAGRRIAEVTGAEAGLVTAGSFSSMVLAAAACLTGADREKIGQLPHPTWDKRECVMQKGHRFGYDCAFRAGGATIVDAETKEELMRMIGPRTAFIGVLASVERSSNPPPGLLMPHELVAIGKQHGVPVVIDAASELPPVDTLTRYVKMGADLVIISGGKGILGPQSTGILAGRKALIEAAYLNHSPNTAIGRGMKVGKEEIVGFIVALNRYLALDHEAVMETWNRKAHWMAEQLQGVPGLHTQYRQNAYGFGEIRFEWDQKIIPLTPRQVQQKLQAGEPRVVYYEDDKGGTIQTRTMQDGEEILAARRLRQFFLEEARRPSSG
jgi:D-glucosaminate-6-phosphate ammonia-lyase